MSTENKNSIRLRFAEAAMDLADMMVDATPVIFLQEEGAPRRDTSTDCVLSGEAGRIAVLSMTICNPLSLKAASVIEGAMN